MNLTNTNLEKLMIGFLYRNGALNVLPDYVLQMESQPAHMDMEMQIIYPPYEDIDFKVSPRANRNAFISYVARQAGLTYVAASDWVNNFFDELQARVESTGMFVLPLIGIFKQDEGKFIFEQNPSWWGETKNDHLGIDFELVPNYHKADVQKKVDIEKEHAAAIAAQAAAPVVVESSETKTATAAAAAAAAQSNYNEDENERLPFFVMLGLLLLLLLGGLSYWGITKRSHQPDVPVYVDSSRLNRTPMDTTVAVNPNADLYADGQEDSAMIAAQMQEDQMDEVTDPAPVVESKPDPSVSNSNESRYNEINVDRLRNLKSTSYSDCVVIVGAFANHKNLYDLKQKMEDAGLYVYIDSSRNLSRIGFYSDCGSGTLGENLKEARADITYDAWVLKQ